jgi:hypothetical protein
VRRVAAKSSIAAEGNIKRAVRIFRREYRHMNTQAHMTRHDLEARIVQRSWEDKEFRQEFLADPAGSFSKYLQVPASSLPKIEVHEETTSTWHIVLPAKAAPVMALSDTDLERVAGGITTPTAVVVATIGFSVGLTVTAVAVPVSVVEGGW